MRRFLISIAILIGCEYAAQAQEARAVARFDTPFCADIYTFLDGEFGKHFSYSLSNHWVSGKGTGDLYKNTWRSDSNDWCDWAYLTATFGDFSITAGKNCLLIGLTEYQPADVDNYSIICSSLWQNLCSYQPGISVSYDIPVISTTASLQFCSSPYTERPFTGHETISFGIEGEYSFFRPHYTVNRISMDKEEYGIGSLYLASFGNVFQISDNFSMYLDYLGKYSRLQRPATTLLTGLEWFFMDGMSIKVRGGYDRNEGGILEAIGFGERSYFAGLCYEFHPIKFIRVHAAGSYNSLIGFQYDFGLSFDVSINKQ